MSDNERHQAAEQANNPARRRRRRSRRRGGSTGRHTDSATTRRDQTRTQQEGTPDHNQAADQQSLSEQPRRRRRRRRPTSTRTGTRTGTSTRTGGTRTGTSQRRDRVERAEGVGVDKRDKPAEGRARRRPQKRRTQKTTSGARTRVGPRPRMHTSMETSAGGLVVSGLAEAVRDDGTVDLDRLYVALIGRLDRRGRLLWSMPKGHVEVGEQHDRTAEREVWEETGIYGEVLAELGVIDYWFVSEGKRIHKTVHHHLLRFLDGDLNDEDPEVTEVAWVPVSELIERLAYADERKLARRAHDMLPEVARREKAEGRITPR